MYKNESARRRSAKKSSRKLQLERCRATRKATSTEATDVTVNRNEKEAQVDPIQPRNSASKRKLAYCDAEQTAPAQFTSSLPRGLVDLDVIQHLFTELLCPYCHDATLQLRVDSSRSKGLALCCLIHCSTCNKEVSRTMSSSKIDSFTYDVNRRFVAGMLNAGLGHGGADKFCYVAGLSNMSQPSFNEHTNAIFDASKKFSSAQKEKAIQKVREVHGVTGSETLDLAVSFDGSWQKRGHTSKHGIGAVIEQETGLVIDYHVLSSYCQVCLVQIIIFLN